MYKKEIELLKGIAILFILISNAINYWFISIGDLQSIIAVLVLVLDLFGATFYIFLNSFSMTFLIEKKMGCIVDKSNRNKLLKQGFFLLLLGMPFNLIINITQEFPFNIWGWNILTFLGFSQILCYIAYKMVRWTRIIIALIIIFQTSFLREILFFYKDVHIVPQIIYYILVSPYPNYSPLPYAAFSFFSTVFGELIYEAKLLRSREAESNAIKAILKYGTILLLIGLLLPIAEIKLVITEFNYNPNDYPFIDMPSILKSQFVIFISNLPGFLLKGTQSNIFINLGISLLLIGSVFNLFFCKEKKLKRSRILILFGEFSITLLFIQYIFLYGLYQSMFDWFIFIALAIYLLCISIMVYLWAKIANLAPNLDQILKYLIRDT